MRDDDNDSDNATVSIEIKRVITRTYLAILVRDLEGNEIWVPKSEIENWNYTKNRLDDDSYIEIPEWLAEDKGWF